MWKSLRGSKVVDWNKQQVKDTATAMLGALPIQARQIIENGSFKGPDIMKIEKKRNPTVTDIKKKRNVDQTSGHSVPVQSSLGLDMRLCLPSGPAGWEELA